MQHNNAVKKKTIFVESACVLAVVSLCFIALVSIHFPRSVLQAERVKVNSIHERRDSKRMERSSCKW